MSMLSSVKLDTAVIVSWQPCNCGLFRPFLFKQVAAQVMHLHAGSAAASSALVMPSLMANGSWLCKVVFGLVWRLFMFLCTDKCQMLSFGLWRCQTAKLAGLVCRYLSLYLQCTIICVML